MSPLFTETFYFILSTRKIKIYVYIQHGLYETQSTVFSFLVMDIQMMHFL